MREAANNEPQSLDHTYLSSDERSTERLQRSSGASVEQSQDNEDRQSILNEEIYAMDTDFGNLGEKHMEWIALRQIVIVYILCATAWLGCLIMEEPDCGIPIRSYCVYYLFFRMFRNVHDGIGVLLRLNDTPFYYKPNARLLIFFTFEAFEFSWLLYGQYLFYFSKSNTCT